jgi:NADPH-dependent 2,4-dienoyl-CoA reductase/sulfur reductase-like enzyme/rhodanese-related sulfurtransferase
MSDAQRVVVIGAVACGAKAASRLRRLDGQAKITMVDQGRYVSYAGCGLPYYVEGKVKELEDLLKTTYDRIRDEDYFKKVKEISVLTGTRALRIDRAAKTVEVERIAGSEQHELPYDKLVLAMGASPIAPPVEGLELEGVFHLTRMEDAAAVHDLVEGREGGRAVVIGGGFIGIEASEALAARRWDVTLIEKEGQVFPWALDPELAAHVGEHLFENMVTVHVGTKVLGISGEGGRVKSVESEVGTHEADLVILATGVRPNVDIARDAGLEIGSTGALRVDRQLRTSDPDIFAGGDLVENDHLVTGKPCYIPLGSTANKHGRVIADAIHGLPTEFPGVLGTFVCKAFEFNVGSTGLNETAARQAGYDVVSVNVPGFDRAHYYPDAEIIGIKTVVERENGRLLGLQAVGKGDVARRIDVAATAISLGATIDRLPVLDLAYAPPFAAAIDCFLAAINATNNQRAGLLHGVPPGDVRRWMDERDDFVILDVRTEMEFERSQIDHPAVVNIPIEELVARRDELPRDKEIAIICLVGLRSFTAQRLLEAHGFEQVRTIEGGMYLWPWKDELA